MKGDVAEGPSEIRITTDKEKRMITFEDTGIGMDRDDLVKFLGTIAKSGSKDFIENVRDIWMDRQTDRQVDIRTNIQTGVQIDILA